MNELLTDDTKVVILLCGFFTKDTAQSPLSIKEYSTLVHWLVGINKRPSDLLEANLLVEAALQTKISLQRLEYLMGRGVQLGFAVEEWQRNGIWVISRSDADYPSRYKKLLKDLAPPLLFGAGQRSLLHGGGVAMVGSRNVDNEGATFAHKMAELCAEASMPVVSGGARGVDQISMTAALDAGGIVIGVLAENLLKKSLERSSRRALSVGSLLLISPHHPTAKFSVGSAMGRNKLIYALADYGLVVSAELKKGGTWAGAEEILRKKISIPVFTRVGDTVPQGNMALLKLGANPWPQNVAATDLKNVLSSLATNQQVSQSNFIQTTLAGSVVSQPLPAKELMHHVYNTEHSEKNAIVSKHIDTIYQAVLPIILQSFDKPMSIDELSKLLEVNKEQLSKWLDLATQENKVVKLTKPVRYALKESQKNMYWPTLLTD